MGESEGIQHTMGRDRLRGTWCWLGTCQGLRCVAGSGMLLPACVGLPRPPIVPSHPPPPSPPSALGPFPLLSLRSHPLMYFPFFYSLKGTLEGRTIEDSLQAARRDMWDNLKHLWTIWVPAQLVNFSVVPLHLRIPFGEACVGGGSAQGWGGWGRQGRGRGTEVAWACGRTTATRQHANCVGSCGTSVRT